MHRANTPPRTENGGSTTRRAFLKKCGVAAIVLVGAPSAFRPVRPAFSEEPEWSEIPPQEWAVGVPVFLDLADYCSQDPSTFFFELDQPLPPGVTLNGSVISGTPVEEFPPTEYVAIAHDDGITGVGSEASTQRVRPQLTAYPNPTSGAVRFLGRRASGPESSGTLRVFSVSGRLVYQRSVAVTGDRYELLWDGRSASGTKLPSGVYMVWMQAGSEHARTRLVITE